MDRENLEFVGIAVGIVAGIFAFWHRWIWPVLRASWGWLVALARMPNRVSEMFRDMQSGDESIHASVRRIETGLCGLTQRQRILVDEAEDAVVETDAGGLVTWVNRTYTRLTGCTLEEVAGHGWHVVIPENERDALIENWADVIADKREYQRYEQNFIGADGSVFRARVRTRAVKTGDAISGYVALVRKV
jgi:PAS domain S-box-containing protein